jgi:hypothetical protein
MRIKKTKKRPRGRPKSADPKQVVSVRLDGVLQQATETYRKRHGLAGPSLAIRDMMVRTLKEELILDAGFQQSP